MRYLAIIAALALATVTDIAPKAARADNTNDGPRYLLATEMPATPSTNIVPGTTVSTTGPVTSSTTIETGTLAGQVLLWLTSAFGTVLGTLAAGWLLRLFKLAGINATDALRARLQQIIVNGLNAGAAAVASGIGGKGSIDVKQPIIAAAVRYVQDHGKDELKALGVDPTSAAAVDAIRARIETAIADPTVPTPQVLTPAPPAISPVIGPQGTTGVPSSLRKG